MANAYIERYEKIAAAKGWEVALNRSALMLAGLVLSREFNETWEQFLEHKPEIAEFNKWHLSHFDESR